MEQHTTNLTIRGAHIMDDTESVHLDDLDKVIEGYFRKRSFVNEILLFTGKVCPMLNCYNHIGNYESYFLTVYNEPMCSGCDGKLMPDNTGPWRT